RREAVERRLMVGGSAVLVGEQGPPAWSHWRLRGFDAAVSTKASEPLEVHARSPSLLELVRNPPKQGYRFRAELSHYDADPSGRVGIFVGYTHKINAQGNVVHCFVAMTFNDCAPFDEVAARQAIRQSPVQILIQVPRNPVRLEVMHWIFNDRG